MPNRIVREGILTSDRIDQLDAAAEVFYRRLMSKVDDHGLYDARPSILRTHLFPLRVDRVREADISRWIAACEKAGLIALYAHEGKPYLQMLDTRWIARSEPKYPLPATANTCSQLPAAAPVVVVVDVDEGDKTPRKRVAPPEGVPVSLWEDFLKIRRAKRAPWTETAFGGMQREAGKAGLTMEQAVRICCERGWQSLKAEWLEGKSTPGITVPASKEPDPELTRLRREAELPKSGAPAAVRELAQKLRVA